MTLLLCLLISGHAFSSSPSGGAREVLQERVGCHHLCLPSICLSVLLSAGGSSMCSLSTPWLSCACSWQRPGDPWRVVFPKKMLGNIVPSDLSAAFH